MVGSIGRIWVLAVMLGASSAAFANTALQRQELTAVLRQLDALERRVRHSDINTPVVAGERYYFDYSRLLADVAQVRSGIQRYLAPSRMQPRDMAELSGDYRYEQTTTDGASAP